MLKLLLICNDFIGNAMAGPGIRCWEMANALQRKGHEVAVLARHVDDDFPDSRLKFLGKATFSNLAVWIHRSDCVIQPGRPLSMLFSILFRKKIIFDQYDPVIFEVMERKTGSVLAQIKKKAMLILWKIRQRIALRFGHRFLVANEKQKDFLIGQLAVLGYADKVDSITVLPFGLPDARPIKSLPVVRGVKIKNTDFLLVWGGGIWDWFDPFTLLHAISVIRSKRDDIKVYFPGIRPPSPDSQKMAVIEDFLAGAKTLGLLETAVFVNTEWTPYERRADYLLEADAGISLHRHSLETRFAFRTRILDYLWAGLPIIASQGDCWADTIEKQELGITVSTENVEAVAAAIIKMADDRTFRENCRTQVSKIATEYEWNTLLSGLQIE